MQAIIADAKSVFPFFLPMTAKTSRQTRKPSASTMPKMAETRAFFHSSSFSKSSRPSLCEQSGRVHAMPNYKRLRTLRQQKNLPTTTEGARGWPHCCSLEKCLIYARYSSHGQIEQSIEGQLRICYEYAKREGLTVIEEYIERALTGCSDDRPDF